MSLGLNYPRMWEYRIIAESREIIESVIFEVVHKAYKLELKNRSRNGCYLSMHLTLEVESQRERDEVFQALSRTAGIKMVI